MFSFAMPVIPAMAFNVVVAFLVFEALHRADWSGPTFGHLVWALASGGVLLGHTMTIPLGPDLKMHYLGAAFLVVLVGYPRALITMAAVFAIEAFNPIPIGQVASDPMLWGLRTFLMGVLPICMMWFVVRAVRRFLPANLFVFMLGAGFFGLVLTYTMQLLTTALVFTAMAPEVPAEFWSNFIPYSLLLTYGECWLEGFILSVLAVYAPQALALFDERHYLPLESSR